VKPTKPPASSTCLSPDGRDAYLEHSSRLARGDGARDRLKLGRHRRLVGSSRTLGIATSRAVAGPIRSLAITVGALAVLSTMAPAAAHAETCPNEAVRSAQAATYLPDCRAYEMVSPLEKGNSNITGIDGVAEGGVVQASENGEAITYASLGSFGAAQGAPLGSQYLARRDASSGDWSTQNITIPQLSATYAAVAGTPYKAFSSDLADALVDGGEILHNAPATIENPPLAADAPPGYEDYYLHSDTDGSFISLLTTTPAASANQFRMHLQGATADLRHVVVTMRLGEEADGTLQEGLYQWNEAEGQLQPLSVLPGGGAIAPGESYLGGDEGVDTQGAISSDGSRAFWTNGPPQYESLYETDDGTNAVQVDASRVAGEEGGEGQFAAANSEGTRVYFTDKHRLVNGSTAASGAYGEEKMEDLYEMNLQSGVLKDVTTQDAGGARVQGVLGASADGSRVYFVAEGVLTSAPNAEGHEPVAGGDNLYVATEGHPSFIATLSPDDETTEVAQPELAHDWTREFASRTVRVSASGRQLVFMSDASLTGYDNLDASTGLPDEEVYLYEASTGKLHCVSCNPSGARPLGPSRIPAATEFEVGYAMRQSRVLSETENGEGTRVFFDSDDALVPRDTNDREDVYEYEHGQVSLISSGTSDERSSFVDASSSGDNVFFITAQQLVSGDIDELVDLYDAREDGGFAQVTPPACTGTGCQGAPGAPPVFATPASATFNGVGNFAVPAAPAVKPKTTAKPCKRGYVKKQGKCARKARRKASKAKRRATKSDQRGRR
jgi:hypothetical protein